MSKMRADLLSISEDHCFLAGWTRVRYSPDGIVVSDKSSVFVKSKRDEETPVRSPVF
jgi:hypothetical protein